LTVLRERPTLLCAAIVWRELSYLPTKEYTMKEDILIDLGKVSEETKGPVGRNTETAFPNKEI
jgi:hypothetical protein